MNHKGESWAVNALMSVKAGGMQQVPDLMEVHRIRGWKDLSWKGGVALCFLRLSHFTNFLYNVLLSLLPSSGQGCGYGGGDTIGLLRLHYGRRYSFLLTLLGHFFLETPCHEEA